MINNELITRYTYVLPYGSLRTEPEIFQHDQTVPAYKCTATIVHCTLTHVPTVQMTRHHHYVIRVGFAFDFGYRVPRRGVGEEL